MPFAGSTYSALSPDRPAFFNSLFQLDEYKFTSDEAGSDSRTVPYVARRSADGSESNLLVCHDYKNPYLPPSSLPGTASPYISYAFPFFNHVHLFVYFSHSRVTIPPTGWINAAHRGGSKILGTLIFEPGAEADSETLRLIVGKLPTGPFGPALGTPPPSLPVSDYYAILLARLAAERGFDGYLLNFESHLVGAVEQARALTLWVSRLTYHLKRLVGPHAEAVWYDSVVVNGRVAWQDRVNWWNHPLWEGATGWFGNYTWPPEYPALTTKYLDSLPPVLAYSKPLQSIYTGLDFWGRGKHPEKRAGFALHKGLEVIASASSSKEGALSQKQSTALFAPAWTYESTQDLEGWTWDKWWVLENALWTGHGVAGTLSSEAHTPETSTEILEAGSLLPEKQLEELLSPAFKPISHFHVALPPSVDPLYGFVTTFSLGIGRKWFIEGKEVYSATASPSASGYELATRGWTDLDKWAGVGDLVWSALHKQWSPKINLEDAWIGGSSLELTIQPGATVPIQNLTIKPGTWYRLEVILKTSNAAEDDVHLLLVPRPDKSGSSSIQKHETSVSVMNGWSKYQLDFFVLGDSDTATLGLALQSHSTPSLKLGLISCKHIVSPSVQSQLTELGIEKIEGTGMILWVSSTVLPSPPTASFSPTTVAPRTSAQRVRLDWATAYTLPSLPIIPLPLLVNEEDSKPAFGVLPRLEEQERWWYFNVFALLHSQDIEIHPKNALWIGTSTDGATSFVVEPENLVLVLGLGGKSGLGERTVRFYIQGVNQTGNVMGWKESAWVDVVYRL